MKIICPILCLLATPLIAQDGGDALPDPTAASARLESALRLGAATMPELTLKGVVLAGRDNGAAIIGTGKDLRTIRQGSAFQVITDGAPCRLVVKALGADGITIHAPDLDESVNFPGGTRVDAPAAPAIPGMVDYVLFSDLPLMDALRLLSSQTGRNYSASAEANKIPVNTMLSAVAADSVVEEICKSHNLWFRKDEASGILRIMTVGEYEKDIAGFRDEQTVVFTLRYPNVAEIAVGIADLYGSRVELSLGAEESDDQMRNDLESRFDRFDVLTRRTQQSNMSTMMGSGSNNNSVSNNVNGFYGSGSNFSSFGSGGGSGSYGGRNTDRANIRRNTEGNDLASREQDGFRDLTPAKAERIDRAMGSLDPKAAGDIDALRKTAAPIYITANRRNNMIAVRTSDSRALADIRALVDRMDVPTPLVLLEVQVVNIQLGREFQSAFDYQFSDGNTAAGFTSQPIVPPVDSGGIAALGMDNSNMTFVFVNENFRARMQLLEQKNRIKTIASPTLLTANNEISRIFLGEERPIVRNINSQTLITDNNVATTPNTDFEYRPVGNTLLITPNINSDRTVTLRLVQEHSFINSGGATVPVVTNGIGNSTNVEQVKLDVVATRNISGTFVAKDGMAVAAGGLIENTDSTKRAQVPVLGNIPVLGLLFRRQDDSKSRQELVVIIRPHVMSTPADGERLSREVLQQLAPASVQHLLDEGLLPEAPGLPQLAPIDDPTDTGLFGQPKPAKAKAATTKPAPANAQKPAPQGGKLFR